MRLRERLAIASLCFGCAAPALAADAPETFGIKENTAATGTLLKKNVVTGNVPFDKRYDEMTPEQRQRIKDRYEAMAADDEPPWPANGLTTIMKAVVQGASLLHVDGPLEAVATVGSDGVARQVEFIKAPNDAQFRAFVTSLLTVTRYKPAVCGGKACVMGFPLQVNIVPDASTLHP